MNKTSSKFRTALIFAAGVSACISSASNARTRGSQNPNIVLILADDMGIGDLGCYGQKMIETTNVDALAKAGIRFTSHYSGSTVSAPSRCCLLTGKDTGHSYIRGNKGLRGFDYPLAGQEVTVAEILKSQGYATACVGKWGLGGPGSEGHPNSQGFDYFFGYLSQGAAHDYYPDYLYENSDTVRLGGNVYSHFMIMDKGLDFIRKHSDKPFFAYFAVTPPHADLDYPDISHYDGRFEEVPHVNKSGNGKGYKSQPKPRATYASMVSEIDANVGRIVSLLEDLGILENTIIVFSSDNGVHHVGGHDPDYFDSNGSFRGYKRDLYEGGIRTPFIVRWDSHIAPGSETGHISAFWDFLPTICDITGAELPPDITGISYLPVLLGKGKQPEHEYIYYEFYEKGGKQSVLKEGWKLVRLNMSDPDKLKEELYYLPDDISEQNDLAGQYPEKVDELRALADSSRVDNKIFRW